MQRSRQERIKRYNSYHAVEKAKKNGELAPLKDLKCVDCGNQACHYDHYNGYNLDRRLDVIPLCVKCHARRTIARGEREVFFIPDWKGNKNPKWKGGVDSLPRNRWSSKRLAHKRKISREYMKKRMAKKCYRNLTLLKDY